MLVGKCVWLEVVKKDRSDCGCILTGSSHCGSYAGSNIDVRRERGLDMGGSGKRGVRGP